MNSSQPRVGAGRPAGGQFAATAKSEDTVDSLAAPRAGRTIAPIQNWIDEAREIGPALDEALAIDHAEQRLNALVRALPNTDLDDIEAYCARIEHLEAMGAIYVSDDYEDCDVTEVAETTGGFYTVEEFRDDAIDRYGERHVAELGWDEERATYMDMLGDRVAYEHLALRVTMIDTEITHRVAHEKD